MAVTAERSWKQAMWRGASGHCPNCGQARIWQSYLKVRPECLHCGAELHHHRADDAPPYFTILIIGHVLVPLIILVEVAYHPAYWLQAAVWLPVLLGSTLLLMPAVKGAIVGLQWALRMHGFAEDVSKP
jgi:uncharacterized protein (DUF983 family)